MPETEEAIVAEIRRVSAERGPYAHNLIGILLRKLARTNKDLADKIFKELP